MIHIKAAQDHNTQIDTTTTGAVHDDLTQSTEDTATDLTVTFHTSHITDHPNIEALQVIDPKITVDHIHDHLIYPQDMNPTNQKNMKVKIKDPHTDYYSSSDHSSDSREDSDHLN